MQILELVNDCAMFGAGIITIDVDRGGLPASRSLIGLFWQKEQRLVIVNFLFMEIRIA